MDVLNICKRVKYTPASQGETHFPTVVGNVFFPLSLSVSHYGKVNQKWKKNMSALNCSNLLIMHMNV